MYLVCKDGMWLVAYGKFGITEFVDGAFESVPTAWWSKNRRDGRPYAERIEAKRAADAVGGEVVFAPEYKPVEVNV